LGAFRWGEIRILVESKRSALLSGSYEMVANLLFMIGITNLESVEVGVFMESAPARSTLIAIKRMK